MRLVQLDELRLIEASGFVGEKDFEAEDFELKIVGKEDSKVQLEIE